MRIPFLLVLAATLASCAYLPEYASQLQLTSRSEGKVYFGTIRRVLPAVVTITLEIDRRTYTGKFESTAPNATFGLYEVYGPPDAPPKSAQALSSTNYTRAILSTSDRRIMNCDFTDVGGMDARGICVDEGRRVYDVVLS